MRYINLLTYLLTRPTRFIGRIQGANFGAAIAQCIRPIVIACHANERRRRRHLIDAAAAEKIDRRAAAAGQNHRERRRRKNDVGAGLYFEQHLH